MPPDSLSSSPARFELFHRLGDPGCSRIRRRVQELGLLPASSFRNVSFDSHRLAFEGHGGHEPPAIWDGELLHEGVEACERFLSTLASEAP